MDMNGEEAQVEMFSRGAGRVYFRILMGLLDGTPLAQEDMRELS